MGNSTLHRPTKLSQQSLTEEWTDIIQHLEHESQHLQSPTSVSSDTSNHHDLLFNRALNLAYNQSIPTALRSKVWFLITGANTAMSSNPDLYSNALQSRKQLTSEVLYAIDNDMNRTISYVKNESPHFIHQIEQRLKRMLTAYANYDQVLGYTQGMNVIAAFILQQFLGNDKFFDTTFDLYPSIIMCDYQSKDVSIINMEEDYSSNDEQKNVQIASLLNEDQIRSQLDCILNKEDVQNNERNENCLKSKECQRKLGAKHQIFHNSSSISSTSSSTSQDFNSNCFELMDILEEKAFWTFTCVMKHIRGIFIDHLPAVMQAMKLLRNYLRTYLPSLLLHFEKLEENNGPLLEALCTPWFTSLFTLGVYNLQITLRLWDVFLLKKCDFSQILGIAFFILKNNEQFLLESDFISIIKFCKRKKCMMKIIYSGENSDKPTIYEIDDDLIWNLQSLKFGEIHFDFADECMDEKSVQKYSSMIVRDFEIQRIAITDYCVYCGLQNKKTVKYGIYKIQIISMNEQWCVWKRFSEFETFFRRLKELKICVNAQMPRKTWISSNSLTDKVMQHRSKLLNNFMKEVLVCYSSVPFDDFYRFVCTNDSIQQKIIS